MKVSRAHRLYVQSKYIADFFSILMASWMSISFSGVGTTLVDMQSVGLIFLVTSSSWYFASFFSGLYIDRRAKKYSEEIIVSFYNLLFTLTLGSAILFFLIDNDHIPNIFWAYYYGLLFFFSNLSKYLIRKYTHYLIYNGRLTEYFILIGNTQAGIEFLNMIDRFRYYGYSCAGILDDEQVLVRDIPYLGKISDLESVLKKFPTHEIILSLPSDESKLVKNIIQTCDLYKRKLRLIPDLEKYTNTNIEVANIGMMPVLNYKKLPLDRIENQLIKRLFDIVFSVMFFLLIGIWLFPLIAIIIKLSSKGPVFFKQERWGIANEKIICYKFRSMNVNSKDIDENGNYQKAIMNDPRITAIGSFLRKTSLDELPQFWNVLMGTMSVIGPRPHPVPLNMESIDTVENYVLRHIVKPGISGWAQVNGFRGEIRTVEDMRKRVEYDLYYIHRWNIFFDIQIILQTVINIFRGEQNAY